MTIFSKIKNGLKNFGFTESETGILLFISFFLVAGMLLYYFYFREIPPAIKEFDYSREDSLFYLPDSVRAAESDTPYIKLIEKKVDYKQELFDFRQPKNISGNEPEKIPPGGININNAGLEELKTLPGIGDVLARRIIEFRDKKGRFSSVDELTAVSGISTYKLEQIKNFIKID